MKRIWLTTLALIATMAIAHGQSGQIAPGQLWGNPTAARAIASATLPLPVLDRAGATGTAGHVLPYLDGTNTWSGVQTFSAGIVIGSPLPPSSGGTGVANNNASTITIAGNFGLTFTIGGARNFTVTGNPTLDDWFDQSVKTTAAPSHASVSLTGAAGAGFVQIANQSVTPGTPTTAGRVYFDSTNRLSVLGTNGFVATLDFTGNSASRVYTFPNFAGTLATLAGVEELTNKTLTSSVGKGTWTASGTWTLPAFTLGGTVSGGANQINNVVIGAVTPLAGSFTTVTASTSVTSPTLIGGSGTTQTLVFQTTTGVGATGADHIWKVGNNGGTEAMRILNSANVGIGTNNPQSLLNLSKNTTQNVAVKNSGTILQIVGVDSASINPTIEVNGFGGAVPIFLARVAGGTAASPTAVPNGQVLIAFGADGLTTGSTYVQGGAFFFNAGSAWSATNAHTFLAIYTTPSGSTTETEAVRVLGSGGVAIGTTTDPGIGSLIVNKVVILTPTTVGSLPTCNAAAKGARSFVTDELAAVAFNTAATGGGTNNVPVFCDGTTWRMGANDNVELGSKQKAA